MTEAEAKLGNLRALLHDLGCAAVAFSSGVDSTFLLHVAHEELGERITAAWLERVERAEQWLMDAGFGLLSGADFNDDRELALRAGYAVGRVFRKSNET